MESGEALSPEKENAASRLVFWPEEVPHMAISANLDEPNLRNTAESWADYEEAGNELRLPHYSASIV